MNQDRITHDGILIGAKLHRTLTLVAIGLAALFVAVIVGIGVAVAEEPVLVEVTADCQTESWQIQVTNVSQEETFFYVVTELDAVGTTAPGSVEEFVVPIPAFDEVTVVVFAFDGDHGPGATLGSVTVVNECASPTTTPVTLPPVPTASPAVPVEGTPDFTG